MDKITINKSVIHYPNDRATGFVLLKNWNGKWYGFGTKTLKQRFQVAAHYSGYGMEFEL